MGTFSSKKKTTSQSTTTTAPSTPYAPYTNEAVGSAQKIYQDNQPLFAGLAGKAMDVYNGLGGAASTASSLANGTNPAQRAYAPLANTWQNDPTRGILTQMSQGSTSPGQYDGIGANNPAMSILQGMTNQDVNPLSSGLYGRMMAGNYSTANPFVDAIAKQGEDAALKAVNQRFAASGMGEGLSTPYADLASRNVADAGNSIRYQNYNDSENRALQAGGQSDSQYNATHDRSLAAAQGLGSLSNSTDALRLNAQQAKDQAFQGDRSAQLAAAQSLGSQYNGANATALGAANGNMQSLLSGLQMQPNIAETQYKGLAGAAALPYAGINSYADLVNALTGRYATTNSSGTTTEKSSPSALSSIGQSINIGSNLASLFSDRRLKTDISRVGTTDDGLGVYTYRYSWGGPVQMGVMADEVAQIRPEALGPVIGGFATVNYGAL